MVCPLADVSRLFRDNRLSRNARHDTFHRRSFTEETSVIISNRGVAFAGRLLQSRPIANDDDSPPIADEVRILQRPGDDGHALAADSQHVSEELLGHRKLVAAGL